MHYVGWELRVYGDAPLARYLGVSGTVLETLLKGRVFNGGSTVGEITEWSYTDEPITVSSNSISGLGHVNVNISIYDETDTLVAWNEEDGFLFGGNILLRHPEE